jgi:hypothetical protein
LGAELSVGDRLTLLGFFSVNLKTALDTIPGTATSPRTRVECEGAGVVFWKGEKARVAEKSGMQIADGKARNHVRQNGLQY